MEWLIPTDASLPWETVEALAGFAVPSAQQLQLQLEEIPWLRNAPTVDYRRALICWIRTEPLSLTLQVFSEVLGASVQLRPRQKQQVPPLGPFPQPLLAGSTG